MHHSRRKSGHGLPNTSMTDVRKAAYASESKHRSSSKQSSAAAAAATAATANTTSNRRTGTSHTSSKSTKHTSSSRDADKYRDEDGWYDDERESFPQFCMTCEKQFVARDDCFLYCSEACREYDQEHGASISTQHFKDSYSSSRIYYPEPPEPRDIIPRASPSRPSSTYFSLPSTPAMTSSTMPTSVSTSSAMAALRSLSLRDSSPPSPTLAPASSGIWPFTSRSAATSPNNSYTQSPTMYASTYDQAYYRTGAPNYYYAYGTAVSGTAGSERPLPPRRPGSHSRPKSIELVTPLLGQ